MRVVYQDCGCVALPDEVVSALGLTPGSVIEISCDAELQTAIITPVDAIDAATAKTIAASCRIRTVST